MSFYAALSSSWALLPLTITTFTLTPLILQCGCCRKKKRRVQQKKKPPKTAGAATAEDVPKTPAKNGPTTATIKPAEFPLIEKPDKSTIVVTLEGMTGSNEDLKKSDLAPVPATLMSQCLPKKRAPPTTQKTQTDTDKTREQGPSEIPEGALFTEEDTEDENDNKDKSVRVSIKEEPPAATKTSVDAPTTEETRTAKSDGKMQRQDDAKPTDEEKTEEQSDNAKPADDERKTEEQSDNAKPADDDDVEEE